METKAMGERIQIAREERCMTQAGLAKAVGCTPQHISAIERGAKVPTLETFVAIAAALRVPTDVLLQDVLPDWWENWEKIAPFGVELGTLLGVELKKSCFSGKGGRL